VLCQRGHAYVPRAPGMAADAAATTGAPEPPYGGTQATMPPPKSKPLLMPFGKHKGTPIEDLPGHYIEWCLENAEIRSDAVRDEMQAQLELRAGRGVSRGRR
jgi:uncharacterized protein (DUF3820 family)